MLAGEHFSDHPMDPEWIRLAAREANPAGPGAPRAAGVRVRVRPAGDEGDRRRSGLGRVRVWLFG